MKYLYKLRAGTIHDEDGQPFQTYGVDCLSNGTILTSVEDIFLDSQMAETFVKLCNGINLPPAYLEVIAQKAVEEYHKIT